MKLARISAYATVQVTIAILIVFSNSIKAEDLTIFDSRRPVALSEKETTYRDFYINGGIEQGVKKDMILTVTRRLTLYDSYRANSPKELMVEVAKVKIIFAQKGLSVARYYEEFSRADRTILEHDFIMVGDKIDMTTAQMESQLKKKSAQAEVQDQPEATKVVAKTESSSLASQAPAEKISSEVEPAPLNSLQ
jgi:hypothetical protein